MLNSRQLQAHLFAVALLWANAVFSSEEHPTLPLPERFEQAVNILEDVDYETYRHSPTVEQYKAAMYIQKIDPWTVRNGILRMLRHKNMFMRLAAASTIYDYANQRLITYAANRSPENIGKPDLANPETIPDDDPFKPVLLDLFLNDPLLDVRAEAVLALGVMKDHGICGVLLEEFRNKTPHGNPQSLKSSLLGYRSNIVNALDRLKCPE